MEVMVAVTLLAIALTAVFRLQSQSVFLASRVRFDTVAPLLAQKVMAKVMAGKDEEVVSDSGDFGPNQSGYTWRLEVSDVSSLLLGDFTKNLKRLDLTVTYGDNVYRYKAEGFRFVSTAS